MIELFEENLKNIRRRVGDAATRSGRDSKSICMIAVTKYVDADAIRALASAGCSVVGESRPQIMWDKREALVDLDLEWHMIGHLQRNKVRRTLECASLIHSVDSQRLLNAINKTAKELDQTANVLLEINISNELAKHGFGSTDLLPALEHAVTLPHVRVKGLMGMASLSGNDSDARREFASLRELRDKHSDFRTDNIELAELSMGMSGDFEIAIEEGATMVRLGSVLFEGIM